MSAPKKPSKYGLLLTMPDPDNPSEVLKLPIHSAPFGKDPPYAWSFYEALGRMLILWGRFEHFFDLYLRALIQVALERGIEEEMQISFKRRATLFKRLVRDIPEISNKLDEARRHIYRRRGHL